MLPIAQNRQNCYQNRRFGPLGSPWTKIIENDPKTDHVEVWEARGSKSSKMVSKLTIWALNETLRRVGALNGNPRQRRETCFK